MGGRNYASRDDFIQYNKDKAEEHQRDSENVEAMKNDWTGYREERLRAFLAEKRKYETAPTPFPKDPEEEDKYVKVKVKPKKGRPKGSKNKAKHPEPNYGSKSTW